jgi:hemerythrin-like domain-containing protein
MKLIDSFQGEHVLIDQVLGSLRTYVDGLFNGTAEPDDGRRFARFFTDFAGHFHHDREEGVFFHALVADAELPADRGPVHALLHDHAEMGEWLREMTPLLEQGQPSEGDRDRLRALAVRYSHALWRHIDAENSVLYPEGAERLGRCGIRELPDRPMSQAEAAAHQDGACLVVRYPPREDASLTRGDGCFMCRAHGETCNGLEAEWWTELEWEEFHMR